MSNPFVTVHVSFVPLFDIYIMEVTFTGHPVDLGDDAWS